MRPCIHNTGTVAENGALIMSESTTEGTLVEAKKGSSLFSNSELRDLTWDSLTAILRDRDLQPVNIGDVLGDGFDLIPTENKGQFVKVPFAIVSYQFAEGENGEFVSFRAFTQDGRKVILNDGSTGICEQLRELHAAGVGLPLWVPGGLRVSRYRYTDVDKRTGVETERDAETYYLSTASN